MGNCFGKENNNGWIIIAIILLFVVLFFTVPVKNGVSCFENVKSSLNKENLKDLDIVMFKSDNCPHCVKMIDVLEKEGQLENIVIADVSTKDGMELAQKYGADKQGVPSFISKKLQRGTVGYRSTVAELIEALTTKPVSTPEQNGTEQPSTDVDISPDSVTQLGIIAFTREGCGWCDKAKKMFSDAGLTECVRIVDITTEEGSSMSKQLLPEEARKGVPAFFSTKTNKHVGGFKELTGLIIALS